MATFTTINNQHKNVIDVQDSPPPYSHTIVNASYSCTIVTTRPFSLPCKKYIPNKSLGLPMMQSKFISEEGETTQYIKESDKQ
jgi:hypothetical protein